jgi:hypothetical protein
LLRVWYRPVPTDTKHCQATSDNFGVSLGCSTSQTQACLSLRELAKQAGMSIRGQKQGKMVFRLYIKDVYTSIPLSPFILSVTKPTNRHKQGDALRALYTVNKDYIKDASS